MVKEAYPTPVLRTIKMSVPQIVHLLIRRRHQHSVSDRDEGNVKLRFDAAAQAYMEWMLLRRGPGSMGVVDITSTTQVIE